MNDGFLKSFYPKDKYNGYLDTYDHKLEKALTIFYSEQTVSFKVKHSNKYVEWLSGEASHFCGKGGLIANRYIDLCLEDAANEFDFNIIKKADSVAHRRFVEEYAIPLFTEKAKNVFIYPWDLGKSLPFVVNIGEHTTNRARLTHYGILHDPSHTYTYTLKHSDRSISVHIVTVMQSELTDKVAGWFLRLGSYYGVASETDIEIDDVVTLPVGRYDIELSE